MDVVVEYDEGKEVWDHCTNKNVGMIATTEDLDHIGDGWTHEDEQRIYALLQSTLRRTDIDTEQKSTRLADRIEALLKASSSSGKPGHPAWLVWKIVVHLASKISHAHPWNDCLAGMMRILLKRDLRDVDLDYLPVMVAEEWGVGGATVLEAASRAYCEWWKNLSSFLAKFSDGSYSVLLYLPIWALRQALEEPPARTRTARSCRLWVACEWLLRCPDFLLAEMTSAETAAKLEEDRHHSECYRTGETLRNERGERIWLWPVLGLPRWEFWRRRLVEIYEGEDSSWLDDDAAARVAECLLRMDAARRRHDAAAFAKKTGAPPLPTTETSPAKDAPRNEETSSVNEVDDAEEATPAGQEPRDDTAETNEVEPSSSSSSLQHYPLWFYNDENAPLALAPSVPGVPDPLGHRSHLVFPIVQGQRTAWKMADGAPGFIRKVYRPGFHRLGDVVFHREYRGRTWHGLGKYDEGIHYPGVDSSGKKLVQPGQVRFWDGYLEGCGIVFGDPR